MASFENTEANKEYSMGRVALGLDRGFQALGGDSLFSDKPPVDAGDACSAVDKGSGVNGFHRVRGDDKLDSDLHSRRRLYKCICAR